MMNKSHTARVLQPCRSSKNRVNPDKENPPAVARFCPQECTTRRVFGSLSVAMQTSRPHDQLSDLLSQHRQHQRQLGEAILAQTQAEQEAIVRLMQADSLLLKLGGLHHRVKDLRWLVAQISLLLQDYRRDAEHMYSTESYRLQKSYSLIRQFQALQQKLKALDCSQLPQPGQKDQTTEGTEQDSQTVQTVRRSNIEVVECYPQDEASQQELQQLVIARKRIEQLQADKNRLRSQLVTLRDSEHMRLLIQSTLRSEQVQLAPELKDVGLRRLVLEAEVRRLEDRKEELLAQNQHLQCYMQSSAREVRQQRQEIAALEGDDLSSMLLMQAKALESVLRPQN